MSAPLRDTIADALAVERSPAERLRLGRRLLRQVRESLESGTPADPRDLHVIEAAMCEVSP